MLRKWTALFLAVCLLMSVVSLSFAETANPEEEEENDTLLEAEAEEDWVTFLLVCNEGMKNDGGNVGNTMMVVSLKPTDGRIKLMMLTWDTFINYAGYDLPQLIDQPYRNNGPEETMKVFNDNFGTDIDNYMSLNYLNLASLIDEYGGVDLNISRAERNALNSMVASKKETLQAQADSGLLNQLVVEMLAQEYYLTDYAPDTHLNGLQAVGYGWLQYDSVYNCCQRELKVIADLFTKVGDAVSSHVIFYDNESGVPEYEDSRRKINLDALTEGDIEYLYTEVSPIFQMSTNNMTDDEIVSIFVALSNAAYQASRQGVNVFDSLETSIFPLEVTDAYVTIAGIEGHLIDYDANGAAMKEFLYPDDAQ